jgi:hypothetical protein
MKRKQAVLTSAKKKKNIPIKKQKKISKKRETTENEMHEETISLPQQKL